MNELLDVLATPTYKASKSAMENYPFRGNHTIEEVFAKGEKILNDYYGTDYKLK